LRFDVLQLGCHAFADGLSLHSEATGLVNRATDVREPQEIKGLWLPFSIPLPIFGSKPPELNQAGLVGMQFQPVFPQSFLQLLPETLRFFLVLEPHHQVSSPGESHPDPTHRNIYVQSLRAGQRVMASVVRFLEQNLRLRVNRAKSAVAPVQERKFLGYRLLLNGKLGIAPKSLECAKDKR
jgi:hypothetical protein